jgi:hypothetical protein
VTWLGNGAMADMWHMTSFTARLSLVDKERGMWNVHVVEDSDTPKITERELLRHSSVHII